MLTFVKLFTFMEIPIFIRGTRSGNTNFFLTMEQLNKY